MLNSVYRKQWCCTNKVNWCEILQMKHEGMLQWYSKLWWVRYKNLPTLTGFITMNDLLYIKSGFTEKMFLSLLQKYTPIWLDRWIGPYFAFYANFVIGCDVIIWRCHKHYNQHNLVYIGDHDGVFKLANQTQKYWLEKGSLLLSFNSTHCN